MSAEARIHRHETVRAALREAFIAWQCRLRQMAMRESEGRPSVGMCPLATPADAGEPLGRIVVLLHRAEPEETTMEFRHLARRTHDPRERREAALKLLQSAHYQRSRDFGDRLTALFGPGSATFARLLASGEALLSFEQYSQGWKLPCRVRALEEADPLFQATYWHSALFNAALPAGVEVLSFAPDWDRVEADPAPPLPGR